MEADKATQRSLDDTTRLVQRVRSLLKSESFELRTDITSLMGEKLRNEKQMDLIDADLRNTASAIDRVGERVGAGFERVDQRLGGVDQRLAFVEAELRQVRRELDLIRPSITSKGEER